MVEGGRDGVVEVELSEDVNEIEGEMYMSLISVKDRRGRTKRMESLCRVVQYSVEYVPHEFPLHDTSAFLVNVVSWL